MASPEEQTKPAAWKPRWRTDPTARPSVSLYAHKEIGERLNTETTHTFSLPNATDEVPNPTRFVCIFSHLKANPNAPHELWTRNHIDMLERNLASARPNDPLPLFRETPHRRGANYEFAGWYEIEAWELVKGGSAELREFIEGREESKGVKSVQSWASALGHDWAKVKMRKVSSEGLGDPLGNMH
ncbi:hypothetical protein EWM64_g2192 [Hericium alpestre]|uniref:Uncharacterized protein n=1 Tax=Hericium alpestre TaxID=135208 RepID=A0A4Z0A647_9AGAM|nr:hypothetical protein EWM64_g2192 [Hericium alpestre]